MRFSRANRASESSFVERADYMFFWFAGLSFVSVVLVFGSAAIDYRLVILGAVLPGGELIWGGPWLMHTLLFPVGVMVAIMVLASGRRLVQRRWLGFAIGLFLHLVFDGSWRNTSVFWWPGFGTGVDAADVPGLPPLGLVVAMEVVGLVLLAWSFRRFGLDDLGRRETFVRTGKLDRRLMGDAPPTSC